MIINHNLMAMNTHRQMGVTSGKVLKSMERLSSGMRINRAGDDAAGLAISEKMRSQIRGLKQATRNAQDGISLIQTGEGALNETHQILQRMRELSVQSANDTNTAADRSEIQEEVGQLRNEIDRIAKSTEFNGKKLLNGSIGTKVSDGTQVGGVEVTSTTKQGTYTVDVTKAGVKMAESAKLTVNDDGFVSRTDIDAPNPGTLTINGIDVTVDDNDTLGDVIDKIKTNVNGVTAYIENGDMIIETTDVGADATLTIKASTLIF